MINLGLPNGHCAKVCYGNISMAEVCLQPFSREFTHIFWAADSQPCHLIDELIFYVRISSQFQHLRYISISVDFCEGDSLKRYKYILFCADCFSKYID
jgi:hypothetical protein